ncbi:succinylglutamate desuccinylase [Halorussus sp. AFM4]|uniref:succinylglutamate desuccinylase n=1 Tax=Halorussus sp. AFM4 TaxID=3421651 RepID=UPI003EBD754F
MRVETLGDGTPEVAVAGAIHGDEPCGVRAIERFLESDLADAVERPVKLIVANERALAAGERYVEADLNRVFPGDPDSEVHEERLAHDLLAEIDGCTTLGFHSTVSTDEAFGTLADLTPRKAEIMRAMPVAHAADFTGVVEGRSVNLPDFVNVEAGYQGSAQAAENAYDCLVAYLRLLDVLPGAPDPTPTDCYRVREVVRKDPGADYEVYAENFERVAPGEVYAATTDGDRELAADREFWPVLLSATGHSTLLGYEADYVGEIGDVAAAEADGSA